MAVTEYGNTVVEALSIDIWPDKPDGWFLKALDTGESYIRRNGVWEYINLGLAFIKATKSGIAMSDINGDRTVIFNTPYINSDYSVALTCNDPGGPPGVAAFVVSKLAGQFSVKTRQFNGVAAGNILFSWLATRNYNP